LIVCGFTAADDETTPTAITVAAEIANETTLPGQRSAPFPMSYAHTQKPYVTLLVVVTSTNAESPWGCAPQLAFIDGLRSIQMD